MEESPGRFRTEETVSRYSRLDLYLMGLLEASGVAPFFVVTGTSANVFGEPLDNESTPREGVIISGTRTDLTIDEVIRALGERRPKAGEAPTTHRHAWVLLSRPGEPPTSDDIAQLHDARYAFLGFYNERPWDEATSRPPSGGESLVPLPSKLRKSFTNLLRVRMLWPESALVDGERLRIEPLGLRATSLTREKARQVFQSAAQVGMIGFERLLADLEGASAEAFTFHVPSLSTLELAEIVEHFGHEEIFGAERFFRDPQGAPQ